MRFRTWLESEEPLKVIDTTTLTDEDQYKLGHAAVVGSGYLIGYHVTDNVEAVKKTLISPKKLTATYSKGHGKYAELGPGLYVSAAPQMWLNRSRGKWDFLKTLTPEQKQSLANALRNHQNIKGQMVSGKLYRYVSKNEEEAANMWIDQWLQLDHPPTLTMLAGQPYNIPFWRPDFLKPLGIDPSESPKVVKITFTGKFVDMRNDVGNWSVIADCIHKGYDGGFSPGGIVSMPELCIWRKECISDISEDQP